MPIEFPCPHCGQSLRTPDDWAGRQAKCPSCSAVVVIPAPAATYPTAPLQPSGPAPNPYQAPVDAAGGYAPPGAPIVSSGPIQPTVIGLGETFRRAWAVFSVQWPAALGIAIICLVINMIMTYGIQFLTFIFAMASGVPILGIIFFFPAMIIVILVQMWINIGQCIYFLKLVRGQQASVGDVFSGAPYLARVLGATLLLGIVVGLIFLAGWVLIMIMRPLAGVDVALSMAVVWIVLFGVGMVICALAFWPYQLLIIDQDVGALESFGIAAKVTSGNYLIFLALYLITAIGGVLLTLLTCGLGILAVVPFALILFIVTYLGITGQPIGSQFES